jgi:hypothetical protein
MAAERILSLSPAIPAEGHYFYNDGWVTEDRPCNNCNGSGRKKPASDAMPDRTKGVDRTLYDRTEGADRTLHDRTAVPTAGRLEICSDCLGSGRMSGAIGDVYCAGCGGTGRVLIPAAGGGDEPSVLAMSEDERLEHVWAVEVDLPFNISKWLTTITAHCHVIRDPGDRDNVTELAWLIERNLLDLANAIRAGGGDEGWRDIASAPKDGTPIIGMDRTGNVFDCRWWSLEQIVANEGGDPGEYEAGWYHDDDEEVGPKWWMPLLPPPPAAGSDRHPNPGPGDDDGTQEVGT